ncbi:hypothetical protein CBL_13346 [Carabus blaptoides fortunei]
MDRIINVLKRNEEFRDGAGPSWPPQAYGTSPLSEYELNKRKLRDRLQQIYISAYILKRVNKCPDTRCDKYDPIWDVVEHLLEVHYDIPNALIELENHYSIPIEVHKLEYGRSKTVAVLLIPIANMRDYETPSDRSTMPLIMLAARINPYNNNNPNTVFSRGNCLLVAAHNITALTHEYKIPLDVEITLKIQEQDLI